MILVILGHSPTTGLIRGAIYSFHLPFFFFLSGFLYNNDKYQGLRPLLASRLTSLLIPYSIFTGVGLLFVVLRQLLGFELASLRTLGEAAMGSLFGIRGTSPYNGTLWFIPCLLAIELIYTILNIRFRRNRFALLGFSVVLSFAFLSTQDLHGGTPWLMNLDVAAVMLVFFSAGNLVRARPGILNRMRPWHLPPLAATALATTYLNQGVDAFYFSFGSPALFLIHSFSGIAAAAFFFSRIPRATILSTIGRTSLVFLALHQYLIFSALNFASKELRLPPDRTGFIALATSVAYVVIAVAVLLPVARLLERHAPFVIGKPPQIHPRLRVQQ